jgi:cell wall-associated NlpC family hydrolase
MMRFPRILLAIVLAFLFLIPPSAYAEMYTYIDANGCYHFTNIRPVGRNYRVVLAGKEKRDRSWARERGRYLNGQDRSSLVEFAKDFVGTPYRFGGENAAQGLDCSAFVKTVFSQFNVALPRNAREQYKTGTRISKDQLATGDLVFFKTRKQADYPTHVGIFLEGDTFIHATSRGQGGVRVDSLSDGFYRKTFLGATRISQ